MAVPGVCCDACPIDCGADCCAVAIADVTTSNASAPLEANHGLRNFIGIELVPNVFARRFAGSATAQALVQCTTATGANLGASALEYP
jgi:hypothetical protein